MPKDQTAWETNYRRLQAFAKENGHCNVPFSGEWRNLAKWSTRIKTAQNHKRKNGIPATILDQDQKRKLDLLGYDWSTQKEKEDVHWNDMYQKLVIFEAKNGHCSVPPAEDGVLANWVMNQRKRASVNKLRQDRKEILQTIGFGWSGSKKQKQKGIKVKVKQVNKAKKKKSRGNTKNDDDDDDDDDDDESGNQNETATAARAPMIVSKIAVPKFEKKWKEMFEELKTYKNKHGDCNVPYNYPNNLELGRWVSTQRRVYRQKTFMYGERKEIDHSRKALLESVAFDFCPLKKKKTQAQAQKHRNEQNEDTSTDEQSDDKIVFEI